MNESIHGPASMSVLWQSRDGTRGSFVDSMEIRRGAFIPEQDCSMEIVVNRTHNFACGDLETLGILARQLARHRDRVASIKIDWRVNPYANNDENFPLFIGQFVEFYDNTILDVGAEHILSSLCVHFKTADTYANDGLQLLFRSQFLKQARSFRHLRVKMDYCNYPGLFADIEVGLCDENLAGRITELSLLVSTLTQDRGGNMGLAFREAVSHWVEFPNLERISFYTGEETRVFHMDAAGELLISYLNNGDLKEEVVIGYGPISLRISDLFKLRNKKY